MWIQTLCHQRFAARAILQHSQIEDGTTSDCALFEDTSTLMPGEVVFQQDVPLTSKDRLVEQVMEETPRGTGG